MKRLVICFVLLLPTLVFAQAAPLKLKVTYKAGWSDAARPDDCTGKGGLRFEMNIDLAPFELKYWDATTRRWQGEGPVTIVAPQAISCTSEMAFSDTNRGRKPTFSSVWNGAGLMGHADVTFEEHEDGVIRYRINVAMNGGKCHTKTWTYDSDGTARVSEGDYGAGLYLEETGPDGGEHEITPATPFTKQDLAKGFNRSQRMGEAAGTFCETGYGNDKEVGEWNWTMSYSPNASTATLALNVCSDVVVGSATNMRATATPAGGKFTFKSNKSDVVQVLPLGSNATVAALQPGSATVDVEYESPKGERATASEVIHCVQVKDVNKGAPVTIGLYDAKGNKKETSVDVPIEVLPAENARRVIFKPTNPILVSAFASDANSLTVTGLKPGKTTVQGMTSCGVKTGPVLSVEVVPCESEVIAQLKTEEKYLRGRLASNLAQQAEITGDPEFERAAREGPEHIEKLAIKTAELIAATMKFQGRTTPGADEAIDGYTYGKMGRDITTGAYDKAATTAILKQLGTAGKKLSLAKKAWDATQAARDVGRDLGTVTGAADRLAELEEQQTLTYKELERVWKILKDLCKATTTKEPPAEKPPTPPKPVPKKQEAQGKAPEQLKTIDVPPDPPKPDAPTPPTPPPPPQFAKVSVGLQVCKPDSFEKSAFSLAGESEKYDALIQKGAAIPEAEVGAWVRQNKEALSSFVGHVEEFNGVASAFHKTSTANCPSNSFEVSIKNLRLRY
ncbi:MAG TPA: hypothetical protein VM100_11640 [Longimicrobiales bacterium]|nr:hypothetical protein [Longimicrobiales bacterium]